MEKRSTALTLSLTTGAALMIGGAWYIINDLLGDHQGLLFEGIVAWSLGLLLTSIVVLADRIRQAHDKFSEVFNRQADIQEYLTTKFNEERIEKNRLANMMRGNMTFTQPDGTPRTVDLNDPNDMMKAVNESFMMFNDQYGVNWSVSQDNQARLEELEKELAKAVAEENFERAKEIKKEIAFLKGLEEQDSSGEEENPESPE